MGVRALGRTPADGSDAAREEGVKDAELREGSEEGAGREVVELHSIRQRHCKTQL